MLKKWPWLLGLLIVLLIGAAFFWWQKSRQKSKEDLIADQNTVQEDCTKAEYSFACYLDRAMKVNDINLCAFTGQDKRIDCLKAYAEIKDKKIDCAQISDPNFQLECQLTIQPDKK